MKQVICATQDKVKELDSAVKDKTETEKDVDAKLNAKKLKGNGKRGL